MSADLARLLRIDPLLEAEKITGQSYKEDRETSALGFGLHLMLSKAKESVAKAARDSYFSMNLAETLALFSDMGFAEVLRDEFTGAAYSGEPAPAETFHIFWRAGILATVESYNTTGRNSSKAYYNLALGETIPDDMWSRTSSGSLTDDNVWVGEHDAREGVRTNLDRLAEVGTFLPVWVKSPFLWLVTYAETKLPDYDYEAINAERIARLPERVQRAICGGVR